MGKKSFLLIGGVLLAFLIIEPFFRMVIPRLGLNIQIALEPNIRILPQISKKGLIPKDYIVLLGDSYAEGMGDWYMEIDSKKNLPFHSAHVIYDRLKRDVVYLGLSGAAPTRYLVAELPATLLYLNKLIGYSIEDPDIIIAYFYEGNDLNDTLKDLRLRFDPNLTPEKIYNDDLFNAFIESTLLDNDRHYKNALRFNIFNNLLAANYLIRSFVEWYHYHRHGPAFPDDPPPPGIVNRVWFKGARVPIPDGLHSPSLDLTEEQIKLGVHVYKKCVAFLMSRFPNSRVGILYIPSPLTVYNHANAFVQIQSYEGDIVDYESEKVYQNSDMIFDLMKRAAQELNVPIKDTRPSLTKKAREQFIHGPYDWKHFNRTGYELLAEETIELIKLLSD